MQEEQHMDELLATLSAQPFCLDMAVGADAVMIRWGIPLGLANTTISANAEAFAVNLASGTPNIPMDKKYEWIREQARKADDWNRVFDVGIVLEELTEAMGSRPSSLRCGRSRTVSSMLCGIRYVYAYVHGFPEGGTSALCVDEAKLAAAISEFRLYNKECSSLFLECCYDVRVVHRREPKCDDDPGLTKFPHESKRAADMVSEEIRKRLKRANEESPPPAPEPSPAYEPSSPKYDPTSPESELTKP